MSKLTSTLLEYGYSVPVQAIDDLILKSSVTTSKSRKQRLYITSWIEKSFTRSYLPLVFKIFPRHIHVLCVRNSYYWSIKSRDELKKVPNNLKNLNSFVLGWFSFAINRLILMRACHVVVESAAQRDYLESLWMARRSKFLVFPGRLADLRPKVLPPADFTLSLKNTLTIGFLGSLNDKRRDLPLVDEFLINLLQRRLSIKIIWLGACLEPTIVKHLQLLHPEIVFVFPQSGTWTESEFLNYSNHCDYLISPLKSDWGYHLGMSTGSLADAIFLKRKVFYPGYVDFGTAAENFCFFYDSAHDLVEKVVNFWSNEEKKHVIDSVYLQPFLLSTFQSKISDC